MDRAVIMEMLADFMRVKLSPDTRSKGKTAKDQARQEGKEE